MAVRKATRSTSTAQQHSKTNSNPSSKPRREHAETARRHNSQLKPDIFEVLRNLNRGYGAALTALHRLEILDHRKAFPAGCLRDYRDRTEALRASANRDLLRYLAGHEEQDAVRFAGTPAAKASNAK